MSRFAVIQIHQDCDYVEDAVCLAAFSTEDKAKTFIQDQKNIVNDSHKARVAYISDYVDKNVELPIIDVEKYKNYEKSISPFGSPSQICKFDYKKWNEFKKPFAPFGANSYITVDNFLQELKNYLYNYQKPPEILVDFNPPVAIYGMNNLFVVEIPEVGE